ncbi:MAG: hypothetical protein M3Y91_09825 [Actinomycetota bacterium]|nr:hypothetical protein [Actinomycetota bacterium]
MIRKLIVVVALVIGAGAVGACGGGHRSTKAPASTTSAPAVVATDTWKPPDVPGPPSTAKFCTLLVAQYQHIKTNTIAVSLKVRQQIVADYVRFTPTVVAAAPPEIAPAAATYLQGTAKILSLLNAAGLNAAKTPPGSIGTVLLDPQYNAASTRAVAFAQQNCHYDIGGGVS